VEKAALKDHINNYYKSEISISSGLFRDLANELCRVKGDNKDVGINWYLGFYERYISVELIYARLMEKARTANKNVDSYIEWFRLYEVIIAKWNILPADTHNMDELGCFIGVSYKSRVIIPAEEK